MIAASEDASRRGVHRGTKNLEEKEVKVLLKMRIMLKQPPLAVIMCMKIFVFCQERKEEVS